MRKKQIELEKQQQELARQRAEEERKLKNLALEERFNSLPKEDQESLLAEFEDSLQIRFMRFRLIQTHGFFRSTCAHVRVCCFKQFVTT
ncbi:MAG: hypothetical protein D3913_15240 [Candidatus Electrothrix sp. LOE1_4_5]|nr:hypothetical protein [Candidatus Electrothrix gigas]